MSAENTIKSYLIDGDVSILDNPTLDLLESSLLVEGYSIEPMKMISNFLSGVRDISGLKTVVAKKDMVVGGLRTVAKNLSSTIFEDLDTIEDNPIYQKLPTSKQEVDGYLKKIHKWFSSKIELDFTKLRQLFAKAYAFIIKALTGVAIVGPIAVSVWATNKIPSAKGVGTVAGIAIILAIITVYLCIINAIDMSDSEDKINFDAALTNIINGFKRLFTTIKIEKGQSKFAMVSTMLTGLLVLFWKYVDVEKYLLKAYEWLKDTSVETANIFKGLLVRGGKKKLSQAALKKFGLDEDLTKLFKWKKSKIAFFNLLRKFNIEVNTLDKDTIEKIGLLSRFITAVFVPLICFMTIIYLFAEMVDQFNLEKIRKGEEGETEEDFI